MFLGDLHAHSTFSDGVLEIPDLIDMYGKRGFGVLAVTDHLCEESTFLGKSAHLLKRTLTRTNLEEYLTILHRESRRAWDKYSMVVIPGFELTKNFLSNYRSAHVLALDVENYISASQEPLDLAAAIHQQGGLAIAAHPVNTRKLEKQTYFLWDQREKLAKAFDAWEVASGPHLFPDVLNSGLPMVASSDLHHPRQMRSWKTVFYGDRSIASVKNSIRQQQINFTFFADGNASDAREILTANEIRDREPPGRDRSLAAARQYLLG